MKPTLIITRPAPQAARFATQMKTQWSGDIIVSPLLEIAPIDAVPPIVNAYIFTSANGVAQTERLSLDTDLPAYCVGQKTADAAQNAGFRTVVGPGNAAGLIDTITNANTSGPLAMIRGTHARGNVASSLQNRGIECADIIAYDQKPMQLNAAARAALSGKNPVVVCLFSPRTAALFADQGPFCAPLHLVAISTTALPDLTTVSHRIAVKPDGASMVDATRACLIALSDQPDQGSPNLEGPAQAG